METWARLLILTGVFVIAAGLFLLLLAKVPFLGRLPGDFSFQRPGFSLYVPLASSILLSIVLTLVLNVLLRLFGK